MTIEEKKQKAINASLMKRVNAILNKSFNKDPEKNKKLKMISKYQDGTITPNVIDDIFGQNYSKLKEKLKAVCEMIQGNFMGRMKTAEKDKTKIRNYIKIFTLYRSDILSLVRQNLNFEKTLLGNIDTLLYLRTGK
jgi:hypothetical protein